MALRESLKARSCDEVTPARECVAPDRQENLLKWTNPLDKTHLIKSGATHPPHTDIVAEIQNTLSAGTDVKLSGIETIET